MDILKSIRLENINGEECHILIKKNDQGNDISLTLEVYYYNRYVHEWLPYSTLGITLPDSTQFNKYARAHLRDI